MGGLLDLVRGIAIAAAAGVVGFAVGGVLVVLWIQAPLRTGDRSTALARATSALGPQIRRWAPPVARVAALTRARVHLADGPLSEACVELEDLLAGGSSRHDGEVRLYLGIALLQAGHYADAADHLRVITSSARSGNHLRGAALRMLAAAEMRRGSFASAAHHVDQAELLVRDSNARALATKMRANLAYAQQDWQRAGAQYVRYIDVTDAAAVHWSALMDQVTAMRMMACVCAQQGDRAAARSGQQRATALVNGRPDPERFTGQPHFVATGDLLDATVQRLTGDPAGGLTLATRAARAFRDLDEDQRCFALREEARCRRDLGDLEGARSGFDETAGWFAAHGAEVEAERTRTEQAALPER